MSNNGKIKIKLIRSATGRSERQKLTVKGLGFTKLNQVREVVDNQSTRGMINKVVHLVQVLS